MLNRTLVSVKEGQLPKYWFGSIPHSANLNNCEFSLNVPIVIGLRIICQWMDIHTDRTVSIPAIHTEGIQWEFVDNLYIDKMLRS